MRLWIHFQQNTINLINRFSNAKNRQQESKIFVAAHTIASINCRKVTTAFTMCPFLNRGVPCDHYPWCIGPHCTYPCAFFPAPLDMGLGYLLPPDMGHGYLPPQLLTSGGGDHRRHGTHSKLLTFGGHQWRPVHTCSLEDSPPPILTSNVGHWNTYS